MSQPRGMILPEQKEPVLLSPSLRRTIDRAWDSVWSSGISNPLAVVEYLTAFLLLRRLDEDRGGRLKKLEQIALDGDLEQCHSLLKSAFAGSELPVDFSTWSDPATMERVATICSRIELDDRNHDLLGDCFEYVLGHLGTAGHFGQFRTPRTWCSSWWPR